LSAANDPHFKVLKSELEIGPVYHRLPDRIRAHASICFMALILHRVMRMRLRAANSGVTPERGPCSHSNAFSITASRSTVLQHCVVCHP
jgi:transposase